MKRLFLILFVVLTTLNYNNLLSGTYSGGVGSSSNPYSISTDSDVYELMTTTGDWVSGTFFIVTQNIDCSLITANPIGTATNIFAANINGQGFTISNITINMPTTDYVGFFGYSIGAVISNLNINNATITGRLFVGGFSGGGRSSITDCSCSGTVVGSSDVGGFIGINSGFIARCFNNSYVNAFQNLSSYIGGFNGVNVGMIQNCYSTGTVYVPYTTRYDVGGFCGNNMGKIYNSYSSGNSSCFGNNVGGFCGSNVMTIENCYSTGSASGIGTTSRNIGGFVGRNLSSINYCYSIGEPTGVNYVGGFIGYQITGSLNCNFWGFYNANLYDVGGATTGTDLSDSQIKELTLPEFAMQSSFPCFDFGSTWHIVGGKPILVPTLTEWAAIMFISLITLIGCWFIWKRFL